MSDDKPKLRIVASLDGAETLSDGTDAPEAHPAPPDQTGGKENPATGGDAASGQGKGRDPDAEDIDLACAWLPRTDLGNAERLIRRYGHDFLHVDEWGWLAWDGKRWNAHEADAILARAVHQTIKDIAREAKAWKASTFDFFIETKKGVDIWDSDKLKGWCLASQSAPHISCVARLAQSHLTAAPEQFDADPLALNVDNGTLRFARSDVADYVQFTPHRRSDRMTKIAPVAYDPNAACPLYDGFLARVQPDGKMQRHLHAWGGVSLTAMPLARLSFWYGTGRNGKSTLTDIWAFVMGDYAQTIPIESFLDQGRSRRGGEASPDIAALPGVRCLRTSEPDKSSKLDEGLLKLVTGGEPMRARHLNRNFFEFRPVFKMTMQGNYKPRIDGTDEGFWSRFLIVPWVVMIPEGERDAGLGAKLRAEGPGILNRLLDGLRDYLDHGLSPPDAVTQATADYRDDSDPIGRFLTECVIRHGAGSAHRASGLDLYKTYKAWCRQAGERPWSPKTFSSGVRDHGIERIKSSHMYYLGIEMIKFATDFAGDGFDFDSGEGKNRR